MHGHVFVMRGSHLSLSASQVNELCSAVQNIQENHMSTNVQSELMHTSTSAFHEPPVLMPSSASIQGPSVNQRLHENHTAVNFEIDAVSAAAPSSYALSAEHMWQIIIASIKIILTFSSVLAAEIN